MKYILNYKKFNEALLPSQFREYTKEFNRERYEEKFQEFKKKYDGDRNAYRIYLPYDSDSQKSETEIEIEKLLSENGYEILDYISGSAKFKDAKNPSKIGKVLNSLLNKIEDKERVSSLIKKFIEDPIRKSGKEEMLVCISRHPYDIAGADTDRDWSNCMTIGTKSSKKLKELEDQLSKLDSENDSVKIKEIKDKISNIKEDGENSRYLIHDVKEGSLIAYLIRSTDRNIKNPIANLNIKPFINEYDQNDFILASDLQMYGRGNIKFKKVVDDFLKEFNGDKSGLYYINQNVYDDNRNSTQDISKFVTGDFMKIIKSEKARDFFGVKDYKINEDGTVDIINDVSKSLKIYSTVKYPLFNRVRHDFNCGNDGYENQLNLTTLVNISPKIVGGSFYCNNNQLTSLKGSPESVGRNFYCYNNKLVSLEGAPQVGGYYSCRYNPIYEIVGNWIEKDKNKNELIKEFNEMNIIEVKGNKPKLFIERLKIFNKKNNLSVDENIDFDEVQKYYEIIK
jgi:hypothetical protein